MFGFFKFKKIYEDCSIAVDGLFSPALYYSRIHSTAFPNQVFADAYILGFLQSFVVNFSTYFLNGRKSLSSDKLQALFELVLKSYLSSDKAKEIIELLPLLNETEHHGHLNYIVGRREGSEYVNSLIINDFRRGEEIISSFTDFIKRNYLSHPTQDVSKI